MPSGEYVIDQVPHLITIDLFFYKNFLIDLSLEITAPSLVCSPLG
jgi:hypothetical protein